LEGLYSLSHLYLTKDSNRVSSPFTESFSFAAPFLVELQDSSVTSGSSYEGLAVFGSDLGGVKLSPSRPLGLPSLLPGRWDTTAFQRKKLFPLFLSRRSGRPLPFSTMFSFSSRSFMLFCFSSSLMEHRSDSPPESLRESYFFPPLKARDTPRLFFSSWFVLSRFFPLDQAILTHSCRSPKTSFPPSPSLIRLLFLSFSRLSSRPFNAFVFRGLFLKTHLQWSEFPGLA